MPPATTWTRDAARLLLGAWVLAGCAGAEPVEASPEKTVAKLARALLDGHFEEAYALMSSDYRAQVSFEQFKARLEANPEEAAATADQLARATEPPVVRAVVVYDEQDGRLELERGEEGWLVTTDLTAFYDQSTPRNALKAFVRAMARRRYDVVMRLIPNADKTGITTESMEKAWSGEGREEAERLIHNLQAHIDAPIEIIGERATMPYGDRMRVQFVREDGRWKIEDPE